ncbi:MAG: hypothetical protein ACI920_002070 [Saprospiraceae bacterium]|jgi:hypothetical protein
MCLYTLQLILMHRHENTLIRKHKIILKELVLKFWSKFKRFKLRDSASNAGLLVFISVLQFR